MDTFQSVQDEINWSKKALHEAGRLFISYVGDKPFALVEEDNPQTGGKTQKVRRVKPPPLDITHLIRNAMLDLKHSFDRSLYVAAQVSGYRGFNKNYPWAESIEGLRAILRSRQRVKKSALPCRLLSEINRQKPYSGLPEPSDRRYLVREVAQMANDKHTIGFSFVPRPVTQMITGAYFDNAVLLDGAWDAVNNEMDFAEIAPGGAAIYGQAAFSIDVFFERAGPIGKVPVSVAMREFLNAAEACLEGFKRACGQ